MKNTCPIIVFLWAVFPWCAPKCALAADWKMYLYDPLHSSYAESEVQIGPSNIQSLQIAWSYPTQPLGAAPTVMGGIVYIGDWGGSFYAIRASDGSLVWKQYVGMAAAPPDPGCQPAIGVTGQAVVNNGIVYVPGGDSAVYALNQKTGTQLWRTLLADPKEGSYLWSSLTLIDNSLFVGISSLGDCPLVRGGLARIDIENPQQPVFAYLMSADDVGAGIWSTPLIDTTTNTIYTTTGNGTQDAATGSWGSAFLSLDASTLAPKSYYFLPSVDEVDDDDWGSSPTLFHAQDGTAMVAATAKDGFLYVLNAANMRPVWTYQLATGCDTPQSGCGSLSTPAFDGSTLYVGAGTPDPNGSNYGSVYAFQTSGELLWFQPLASTVLAPVTVTNGLVFAATLTGVVALDAATGVQLWDDGGAGPVVAQPVISDGTLYISYASGALTAYRPGDHAAVSASPTRPLPASPHR